VRGDGQDRRAREPDAARSAPDRPRRAARPGAEKLGNAARPSSSSASMRTAACTLNPSTSAVIVGTAIRCRRLERARREGAVEGGIAGQPLQARRTVPLDGPQNLHVRITPPLLKGREAPLPLLLSG
jgi:hypothetical protein